MECGSSSTPSKKFKFKFKNVSFAKMGTFCAILSLHCMVTAIDERFYLLIIVCPLLTNKLFFNAIPSALLLTNPQSFFSTDRWFG